jgi:hypothetical protein
VSNNSEFFLSFVRHERLSELLGIIVDVFGELEHNGDPDIIGSDLHIFVVVVRLEKGTEKTVIKGCISCCGFASILVCVNFGIVFFP